MTKNITEWVDHFLQNIFPSITKEESDMVYEILHWDDEKRVAFFLAKSLFEADGEDEKEDDTARN
jgi:hypothetical protein